MNKEEKLVYLDVNEIYPHPNNPRKELGDLTELSESIKLKGIMQNLTVVRGNDKDQNSGYTVIIGHRRLAAAKQAGLAVVPCVIVDMEQPEQIGTMLLENMQRSDLTLYEQAEGFQMMLDLGGSIEEIAQKSGLSQSTVRRRVKLLELDKERFEESVNRGGSLLDYMELDKIKSAERKNRLLADIGTENFKYRLKQAIQNEKEDEIFKKRLETVKGFAAEITDSTGYSQVDSYYSWDVTEGAVRVPEDWEKVQYFYKAVYNNIYIYKYMAQSKEESADLKAERERIEKENKRRAKFNQVAKTAFELRKEFCDKVSADKIKKNLTYILSFWMWSETMCSSILDEDDILRILEVTPIEKDDEEIVLYSDVIVSVKKSPEKRLWQMILLCVNDSERNNYYNHVMLHEKNESLDRFYDLLILLGYEMSEEEKQMRDGTHKLFSGEEDA